MTQNRVAPGIPTGGQFAADVKTRAAVSLDAHTGPDILIVKGSDITGDHTMVGESGGMSAVMGVSTSSAMPGLLNVETEHGPLYLDPDESYSVMSAEQTTMHARQAWATTEVMGSDLASGHALVGDYGNLLAVRESKESDAIPGMLAVETEAGPLYLDPDESYIVAEDAPVETFQTGVSLDPNVDVAPEPPKQFSRENPEPAQVRKWSEIHRDHKDTTDGQRKVMVMSDRGIALVPWFGPEDKK